MRSARPISALTNSASKREISNLSEARTSLSSPGVHGDSSSRTNGLPFGASCFFGLFAEIVGTIRFAAGFAGFVLMLGCVLVIERELRAVGKVGLSDFATMLRTTRENAKQMRDKMGRDQ